jgi:hypothetical protein
MLKIEFIPILILAYLLSFFVMLVLYTISFEAVKSCIIYIFKYIYYCIKQHFGILIPIIFLIILTVSIIPV